MNRRRALIALEKKTRLPHEYQEVEWIGANKGPAINTGIHAKLSTVIKCRMERVAYEGGSSYPAFFGCSSPNFILTFTSNNNGAYASVGDKTDYAFNFDFRGEFHDMELSKTNIKVDGTVKRAIGATSLSINTARKIAVFARYSSSNAIERQSYTRCAYFQIYDGETLECDLVPCYRKSDNVIGMYDLVSGNFRTNVGSGTFTKGADVT